MSGERGCGQHLLQSLAGWEEGDGEAVPGRMRRGEVRVSVDEG